MKPNKNALATFTVESNHGYHEMMGASEYHNMSVRSRL